MAVQSMEQLVFDGFPAKCGCRVVKDSEGRVLVGYACGECLHKALAYLEELLYLDKVGSVSGPGPGPRLPV